MTVKAQPEQLPLALSLDKAASFENFFGHQGQRSAAIFSTAVVIEAQPYVLLYGAHSSGKTHLCSALVNALDVQGASVTYLSGKELKALPELKMHEFIDSLSPANGRDYLVFDDMDALGSGPEIERALFNMFNRYGFVSAHLVLSVSRPIAELGYQLADLVSRLLSGLTVSLLVPDERDFKEILMRLAEQRGMRLEASVSEFIYTRHTRSISALVELLEKLDHASLVEKRVLTVPFVKKVLCI